MRGQLILIKGEQSADFAGQWLSLFHPRRVKQDLEESGRIAIGRDGKRGREDAKRQRMPLVFPANVFTCLLRPFDTAFCQKARTIVRRQSLQWERAIALPEKMREVLEREPARQDDQAAL